MKIQHKIEKIAPNLRDSKYGLYICDMTTDEYEKVRALLRTILKYGQFENAAEIAQQTDIVASLNNVSIFSSNKINDFTI